MRTLTSTKDMSRGEWLNWRKKGIGSSDAPAVCGVNPYRGAVEVWLEKIGASDDQIDNEKMLWGRLLEEPIAEEFGKRNSFEVTKPDAIIQHDKHDWMIANLDRLIRTPEGEGILEIKTTSNLTHWNGVVPDYVHVQVAHQLAVSGHAFAFVAVLLKGQELKTYKIDRDDAVIDKIIEVEGEFWTNYVEKKVPPAPEALTTKALGILYPHSNGSLIELPPEAGPLIAKYKAAQASLKLAESQVDFAKAELARMLADNEVGKCNGEIVKWKTVNQEKVDTVSLKKDLPDVYASYLKQSSYRRFTVGKE